ncbi:hypothetical protein PCANB_003051 [Pneumocystis canis]|nr:hypothetical protein PCANB_003051 [Pneumocystis canis]
MNAQTAVLLDASNDFIGAIQAYTRACSLLNEVIVKLPFGEYRDRLRATYETYFERIRLLNKLQDSTVNSSIHTTKACMYKQDDVFADKSIILPQKKDFSISTTALVTDTMLTPQNDILNKVIPESDASVMLSSQDTIQPSLNDPSYLLNDVHDHSLDPSKRPSTMEYIRHLSLSDINFLTPIKYLFKPIKGIISPMASLPASPVQTVSTTPNELLDAAFSEEDSNDIEIKLDLQSMTLNDYKIPENKQLSVYDDNCVIGWIPLPDFFPPSPARSTFQEIDFKKLDTQGNIYVSKDLSICEETDIAPFLKTHTSEYSDKSDEKDTQDVMENSNLSQFNSLDEKTVEKKPYNLLYNNSDTSFNFSDKSTTNTLSSVKMPINTFKHVSCVTSATPLLPTPLNISKHGNIYLSLLHNNISPEIVLYEELNSIHLQKPKDFIAKTYWLMRVLQKMLMPFIIKSKGSYLTRRLFIPKDIWYLKDVKIKGEEEKIKVCESLIFTLNKIKSFKQDDLQSLIKELSYLSDMVDLFRFWLLKKFGTEVVKPKKRLGTIKFTNKSKFLIKAPPPEKFNTSKYGMMQFDGPRKMYLTSIYRLFESSQVIEQLINSLDLHELPVKAQDHIHEVLKNISEYESKNEEISEVFAPSTLQEEDDSLENDSTEEESDEGIDLEEIDEECATDDDMDEIDPSNIIETSRTRGKKVDYIKDVNHDDIFEDEEDDDDFRAPLDD